MGFEVEGLDVGSFVSSNTPQILLGVTAVLMTVVISEILKPWIKLALIKLNVTQKLEASALRTLVFFVTFVPVIALDFASSWVEMTGKELDPISSLLAGAALTWTGTQLFWLLMHDVKPVKAIRCWIYRRLGVEDLMSDEKEAASPQTDPDA